MLPKERSAAARANATVSFGLRNPPGALLIGCSSMLLLVVLVTRRFAIEHERFATALLISGPASLRVGLVRGQRARGTARVYVILSSVLLLLPCGVVAALLVKAVLD